jgi:hypothetical protein
MTSPLKRRQVLGLGLAGLGVADLELKEGERAPALAQ